jgi:threonylcarbamoyladenosine tRNA methylthiotransferase MtaB
MAGIAMRVYLDTVGCRLNQAEIEIMARQFRAAGHEIVPASESADLAVINTCAVTAAAAADSRGKIRRLARSGDTAIVATGCWVTLQPQQALEMQHVARVVPNHSKHRLVAEVLEAPQDTFELEPVARVPLPGARRRTRAFIKAQDGCDNHCSFCITTIARGRSRSRSISEILLDVQSALEGGTQEIVLTGVHLGSWGRDMGMQLKLLVHSILRETAVPRLRLSSLEPWDLDGDFFRLWEEPRLCPHLHLPLQSGCEATLRRMRRNTTPASFRALITAARGVIPDVAITTDVIAGFPGETEDEFRESLDFVREMDFAGGHAFAYSPRPGTAAARWRDQIPPDEHRRRSNTYRGVFDEAAKAHRSRHVGRRASVLWESALREGSGAWRLSGLTGSYLRVEASASEYRWNRIDSVALTEVVPNGLRGVIVNSG